MADTITVTCPECDKQFKVAADSAGKKVRCKGCEHVFVVKGPAKSSAVKAAPAKGAPAKKAGSKPEPAKEPAKPPRPVDDDDEDDGKAYETTHVELGPRCPECANEMESEEAILCLHCGYNTRTRTRARTRKIQDVTGGDMFLWLLPGILCVMGILLQLAFNIIYCINIEGWVGDSWMYFLSTFAIKLWLWVISIFGMFFMGKFAVKRLLINNQPPEVELKD